MRSPNVMADYDTLGAPPLWPSASNAGSVERLRTDEDKTEALAFLETRPVHTVMLRGFLRANGLDNPRNRGFFYGYRDEAGRLGGVALIGHATLIEARTPDALATLARKAQDCRHAHIIVGEQQRVAEFWGHYAEGGQRRRLACRELLFELTWPVVVREKVAGLRPARREDLDLIVPAHAAMAEAESGINPLEKDPEGFRERCLRRIEERRTWVLIEDGKLIFKTEIFADTPEAIYLEGIYVNPEERGKGYGLRCLSQLTRQLLRRTKTICILVNEVNEVGQAFYKRAGFKFTSTYETIFLQ